ncbi:MULTISPECIES: hydantoinase B/oxoprolinase family protein [Rhizobium/Agrobacterium group]|uniref:Hydantoin utilization protein n=2 Tax=Rhizobium/Agrobacterium group TaxID=227290 RepID=B9K3J4_ALLAM|nr:MULTISPECIES: hydantoinase B/oxoprolinase family protein [Rhizobium/Agrobacterium group]ACM39442.1 hydantoin utilization protein [Allorhizobium ampelinum S4]MCF1436780.1 hydantoinase B/oxoprolinase family protein [Allorhizobium ampelinum]MCF1449036.1 hydantoinase B/oxoprolinase family protein [Allorhizobium ampelinum]MCF1464938.1 hydantoinase B/oxoprolinase family protein [Allorhizobium ampelinum]MCF1474944.1 hydantoinase B/oxoprolinase family protein [Allorhizobium ampelinum]
MRFSENGYYIEKYLKCANCGQLLYGVSDERLHGGHTLYCSEWCESWDGMRADRSARALLPFEPSAPVASTSTRLAPLDPVTMNILESTMVSVCREMGILLMKTSYSTIFNEGLDFTCAFADKDGEMIAVAEFNPAMIGGMPILMKSCAQEIDFDTLEEGDVILHNDPYRGGLHLPEHTFFKPVFIDGELVGFAVCIGHVAEIGGMVPGAFAGEATEVFQEGLRVPPIKIKKAGKDVDEVWKLLLANVRTPRQNYGDLRAMIASVDLGVDRLTAVIRKYGKDVFKQTCLDLMDYSERRMRAEIASFDDGMYSFEDTVEDDGITAQSYKVAVDVFVQGDEFIADFRRTAKQARGPINATYGVTTSATYNAVLHMTDPSIPKNSGCFRPIKVVSPPGTVANVDFPAPEVAGNTETHPRLAGIVIGAMATCAPERVMAAEAATGTNFVFGGHHPDYDEYFACYDIMAGGWGGRSGFDGNNCNIAINGNCRFNPTEVFETRFPIRVENCELITDSAGAGEYRGGLGYERTLLMTDVAITGSQCTDRHTIRPWALFDGKEGDNGATHVLKASSTEWQNVKEAYGKRSTSKYANIRFEPGDRIRLRTPGGGGFGAPTARAKDAIERDVAEGFVSIEAAEQIYGWTKA